MRQNAIDLGLENFFFHLGSTQQLTLDLSKLVFVNKLAYIDIQYFKQNEYSRLRGHGNDFLEMC